MKSLLLRCFGFIEKKQVSINWCSFALVISGMVYQWNVYNRVSVVYVLAAMVMFTVASMMTISKYQVPQKSKVR